MGNGSKNIPFDTGNAPLFPAVLLALGFGLHNAWVCTTMYLTHSVFGISNTFLSPHGETFSLVYVLSALAYGLTALTVAALDQRLTRFFRSRSAMGAAAAVTCLGTLAAATPPAAPEFSFFLECLSGALTGIGSSTLILYWAIVFSRERSDVAVICGTTGIVAGFAVSSLVIQTAPAPYGALATAAVPFAEFALLLKAYSTSRSSHADAFYPLPSRKSRFAFMFAVPAVLIGASLSVLKHISVQTTLGDGVTPENVIVLLMAGSMALVLFVFFGQSRPQQRQDLFFSKGVAPALACAALLASIMTEETELADLFILVAYLLIETLMWVIPSCISHETRLSPLFLFGVVRGILTLAMCVGTLAAPYAEVLMVQSSLVTILAVTVSVALGFAMMPRGTDILRVLTQCPLVRLVSLEIDGDKGILAARSAQGGDAAGAPDQAGEAEGSTKGGPQPPEEEYADLDADPDEEKAANKATEDRDEEGTRPDEEPEGRGDDRRPPGRFTRRVKLVAQTYLLTKRETDILFELAKGNSPVFIQEKYYISAGTVKTHIRNIYRKLNVHKRQDLMRLIEEFDSFDT